MSKMKILITGANGPLGSRVAVHLAGADRMVIGMSRKNAPANFSGEWRTANLLDANAVRASIVGVQAVVHCASNVQNPEEDVRALENLIKASKEAGTHLVYVSICGIEQAAAMLEYYAMKSGTKKLCVRAAFHIRSCASLSFIRFCRCYCRTRYKGTG